MKWNNFFHKEEVYELAHLHPFEWHFTAEAADKRPDRTYKFHVTFSMHCFTRDPLPNEEIDSNLWYQGPKENRLFCFYRHTLSYQLPDMIKSLGDRVCWHTHHGNYFTIELVTQEGEVIEYEVYFDVTRASRKGWLNLIVQTAYVRTEDYKTTQPRKRRIRLDVVAYNTQLRKPIKRPR